MTALLDEPNLDTAVRTGDVYGLLVEHYSHAGNHQQVCCCIWGSGGEGIGVHVGAVVWGDWCACGGSGVGDWCACGSSGVGGLVCMWGQWCGVCGGQWCGGIGVHVGAVVWGDWCACGGSGVGGLVCMWGQWCGGCGGQWCGGIGVHVGGSGVGGGMALCHPVLVSAHNVCPHMSSPPPLAPPPPCMYTRHTL